jgi:hypothetical protein
MHVPERYPYPQLQMNPYQAYPMTHHLSNQMNYYWPNSMYPHRHIPSKQREYPDVNIDIFEKSVSVFQKIARESTSILQRFADRRFARELMNAAQSGNQKEVDRLIKSVGITTPVTAKYTPSGIQLIIHAEAEGTQCCTLTMFLKWGN